MSDRPFAYICSPYRGDEEANAERARSYCREVIEAGYIPLAPHLYFPQFLSDNIPKEREAGMEMAAALLPQCRVLVVCGDNITEGMGREIRLAQELGIESYTLENIPVISSVGHVFSTVIDHDMRELFHGLENVPDEYRIVGPVSLPQTRTEDALDFDKQIQPFYWVEHGGGDVSVCLNVSVLGGSAYKEEVFATRQDEGFFGNGYDWTLLAIAFLEENLPELQGVVNFDPERGLFCAYSDDGAALERFTLAFKDTCENDAVICDLFSRVDKNLYLKAYEHKEPLAASRETNEKPSVLEQIAASRAERSATSNNPATDKPKSRDPEL